MRVLRNSWNHSIPHWGLQKGPRGSVFLLPYCRGGPAAEWEGACSRSWNRASLGPVSFSFNSMDITFVQVEITLDKASGSFWRPWVSELSPKRGSSSEGFPALSSLVQPSAPTLQTTSLSHPERDESCPNVLDLARGQSSWWSEWPTWCAVRYVWRDFPSLQPLTHRTVGGDRSPGGRG